MIRRTLRYVAAVIAETGVTGLTLHIDPIAKPEFYT